MATRSIKGVLVRNDWAFYESACAFATVQTALPAPFPGIALINNAQFGEYLDIYRAEIDMTQANPVEWLWANPPFTVTPVGGANVTISSLTLDRPSPVGRLAPFSSFVAGPTNVIRNHGENVNFDAIELENGGPFISLPPGYALFCQIPNAGGVNVTAGFWYQVMQDQIVPAL